MQKALSAEDVVALRGDWSRPSESISTFLQQRGSVAVPFNQIYGPGSPDGEVLSPLLHSRSRSASPVYCQRKPKMNKLLMLLLLIVTPGLGCGPFHRRAGSADQRADP
ncbi:Uncharacterized protein predicted to be involved in C-type cytochrome biogenesis [Serratia fonticola]|uniref:Uncharacterized protein predicted to be involved in C-type cytochrome biogenesis n=1 Tax=Serratia fonticola TaxID=47917 RepID=A0A4U9VRF8_SERFO|nr:Uncharacterized protein predicted to be involved in C-type cytochrome biogenesis [Serratia fonticola]